MVNIGSNLVSTSDRDSNYLAMVVKLDRITKHPNADRLQIVQVESTNVIVDDSYNKGDLCVFFPEGSKLHGSFISSFSGYRDPTLNEDPERTGFFENNNRVRAMNLRGQKSLGIVLPVSYVNKWADLSPEVLESMVGKTFDTIKGTTIVEKYIPPIIYKEKTTSFKKKGSYSYILDKVLVPGQVNLHKRTPNLRFGTSLMPDDDIEITYKIHGTSFWVGNLLTKRKKSLIDRFFGMFTSVQETEYKVLYGSRRFVRNNFMPRRGKGNFSSDVWKDIYENLKDIIPKGWTLYGEYAGFDKKGSPIQPDYDYGCNPGEGRIFIYRITQTTPDGLVSELSGDQIRNFCKSYDLEPVPLLFKAKARRILRPEDYDLSTWRQKVIERLEKDYLDRDCKMCTNKVPAEGIILRIDNLFDFDASKLKSFEFIQRETKMADKGILDIEDQN